MMNRKGSLGLRDVMFMMIVFAGIMALMSVFVTNMAEEYNNDQMVTDYNTGPTGVVGAGIGSMGGNFMTNINKSVATMGDNVDDAAGSVGVITGIITGAGTILKEVILAPSTIGSYVGTMLEVLKIPTEIAFIVRLTINLIIYSLIIFVIVSALLNGGKV